MTKTIPIVRALTLGLCFVLAGGVLPLRATNLTGTFRHPDGTPVNGKLIFLLSQPARLNDGSAQVVPMVKIFNVQNGQLEAGTFLYGNDVLEPAGTYYLVRLVDHNNNLLFEQKWSIQGSDLDLGRLTPTTTGVVLADPLVKNSSVAQSVEGPVSFSAPLSAFSLTLHGNLTPGTPGALDLGSESATWREVFADQLRVRGPRPWVDVRAFGAVGDGVTDDTQAFIGAITFAAQNNGTVFVPAPQGGGYTITSTLDIGAIMAAAGATNLHIECDGAKKGATFKNPPTSWILLRQPVGQPGVLIDGQGVVRNVTISHCTFAGGTNLGTTGVVFKRNSGRLFMNNVTVAVGFNASAPENHALIIEDTLWVKVFGGSYLVEGSPGTRPPIVLRGADNTMTNLVGIADFENLVLAGGGIRYEQLTTMQGSAGTYYLKEVVTEGSAMALLEIAKSAAAAGFRLGPMVFINCVLADNVGNAILPLVDLVADNSVVNGVTAIGSNIYPAVRISGSGSTVRYINAMGAGDFIGGGRAAAYAGSKLPAGPATQWKMEGFDIYAAGQGHNQDNRLVNEIGNQSGPTLRIFRDNEATSAFNIHMKTDAALLGLGVGRGWRGWDSEISRTNNPDVIAMDFRFAEINAPAAPTATPAPGGTLAPGTYYYRIEARGSLTNSFSGPGPETSVLVADPNNAVNVSWNAVTGANLYRVIRNTFSQAEFGATGGAGTGRCIEVTGTSVTDDGSWPVCTAGPQPDNKTMRTRHRLDRRSLQINAPGATTQAALLAQNASTDQRVLHLNAIPGTTANLFDVNLENTGLMLSLNNQGDLDVKGRFSFSSRGSFKGFFLHNNTAARDWIFPDATGNVPVTTPFSAALNFPSIAAQSCSALTIPVSGAAAGDPVLTAWPVTLEDGLTGLMYVSATDTVTVRLCNVTAAAIDPANQTFAGRIVK
ncbi:MAG: hypothetical protein K6U02_01125 [Firmicutes bacterium]|nr:hypothetical protein [Bacillota bacterium]